MKTNANVIKLYKNEEKNQYFTNIFGTIDAFIYKAYYIDFILKRIIKDNNACSMPCFISLRSIDDVKMYKTKYLVYFIAIRSSVSNL